MDKYPEYIMRKLRQRRGLNEDDKSQDELIEQMEPFEVLEDVCGWELGYPMWAFTIRDWIQDIYKIEIDLNS